MKILLWIVIAAVIIGGGYLYYSNIQQSQNNLSTPISTEQVQSQTQSPQTASQQTTPPAPTKGACDYLTADEVGSVIGSTAQVSPEPSGDPTSTDCQYRGNAAGQGYGPVGAFAPIDFHLENYGTNPPPTTGPVGSQTIYQRMLARGDKPLQGIGDLAAEDISNPTSPTTVDSIVATGDYSITIRFWKGAMFGTITTSTGISVAQAESLAKIAAGNM